MHLAVFNLLLATNIIQGILGLHPYWRVNGCLLGFPWQTSKTHSRHGQILQTISSTKLGELWNFKQRTKGYCRWLISQVASCSLLTLTQKGFRSGQKYGRPGKKKKKRVGKPDHSSHRYCEVSILGCIHGLLVWRNLRCSH